MRRRTFGAKARPNSENRQQPLQSGKRTELIDVQMQCGPMPRSACPPAWHIACIDITDATAAVSDHGYRHVERAAVSRNADVSSAFLLRPASRNAAIETIRKEVEAARLQNLQARLLIPQTRGRDGAALEYELEVESLDALDRFREKAIDGDRQETHEWMRSLSDLLTEPPAVTIYRIDVEPPAAANEE